VVAFPKIEDAKNIKNILMRNGFQVSAICNSGAQALQYMDYLHTGVLISGYRFHDMIYADLLEDFPVGFEMLLVTSQAHLAQAQGSGIMCVTMPVKLQDLLNTVNIMCETIERRRRKRREQPTKRNDKDKALIKKAKEILMERNNMTESEAHRYIQKNSMDTGVSMVETATMVLSMYV
jgi:response regulator NasT